MPGRVVAGPVRRLNGRLGRSGTVLGRGRHAVRMGWPEALGIVRRAWSGGVAGRGRPGGVVDRGLPGVVPDRAGGLAGRHCLPGGLAGRGLPGVVGCRVRGVACAPWSVGRRGSPWLAGHGALRRGRLGALAGCAPWSAGRGAWPCAWVGWGLRSVGWLVWPKPAWSGALPRGCVGWPGGSAVRCGRPDVVPRLAVRMAGRLGWSGSVPYLGPPGVVPVRAAALAGCSCRSDGLAGHTPRVAGRGAWPCLGQSQVTAPVLSAESFALSVPDLAMSRAFRRRRSASCRMALSTAMRTPSRPSAR